MCVSVSVCVCVLEGNTLPQESFRPLDISESCYTCECVFSNMWLHLRDTSHVARINESFETCGYTSKISLRHVAHMDTCECV